MSTSIPEHIQNTDLKKNIYIKGAGANNLKGIDVVIPKNKLVVVTGVSGSGKSSLVMDTLYAEGQRRYVESLSSYARQFLSRMKKPDIEYIKGISPAIAIEQKVTSSNARSTVGSLTEIYDYLRLLYARIGHTFSPISGDEVKKHTVTDVVDYIYDLPQDTRIHVLAPIVPKEDRSLEQDLSILLQKGYTRIVYNEDTVYIEDVLEGNAEFSLNDISAQDLSLLIDRLVVDDTVDNRNRTGDSVQVAFQEGEGSCVIAILGGESKDFNNRFELDGILFPEPTHQLFNYNNPYGACKACEGYGKVIGIDPSKVIPDDSLSLYEGAVACWKGEKSKIWQKEMILGAERVDLPIHRPYVDLTDEQKHLVWHGCKYFEGIHEYFAELEKKTYKIQNRVMLARYRGKTDCPECLGSRLRKETQYIKINGRHIGELTRMPIDELLAFFENLSLSDTDQKIAERIILEVTNRLKVMVDIGLPYLTLERVSSSLSGGETQRINLTRVLGSNLTNSIYILDEPSIGLHPKDTEKMIAVLRRLRDMKNTVVVVEHEEEIIRAADVLIDIGPAAGVFGGELVYIGEAKDSTGEEDSLTLRYLDGSLSIPTPDSLRKRPSKIHIHDAYQHNLKHIDVDIPLNSMVVVSGVSGSGKTSLVKHILYPGLKKAINEPIAEAPGKHKSITGDVKMISSVEMVSQSPIGRSSRSNPVTYVKAYDAIRKLFTSQQLAKIRGYKPKHFSFNTDGGRCDTCKGDGHIVVEMQFLSDVTLVCDECNGQRFKSDVLEVKYNGKNIHEVLQLSIDEAMDFFEKKKDIISKIQPLQDVGLGYVQLGQSSSTLSGGEAQRLKLASYLNKVAKEGNRIFFIFDEPTTGLHFHDVKKLLTALNALVENGHSVLIVEHNIDVIKSADWLIDLGPEGGVNGGELLYQGPPQGILKAPRSHTAQYLKDKF